MGDVKLIMNKVWCRTNSWFNLVPRLFPSPRARWRKTLVGSSHVAPTFWLVTNKINVEEVLKFGICSYLAYCREEKFPVFYSARGSPVEVSTPFFFFKKINFYCGRGLVRMCYINKLWKNSESQMGDWIHDLLNTGLIFYRLSYKDFDGSSSISFVYGTLRIISWSLGTKVEIWRYERSSRLIRNLSNCEREAWKKKFRLQRDSNPWPLRYRCSALPNWAMKPCP